MLGIGSECQSADIHTGLRRTAYTIFLHTFHLQMFPGLVINHAYGILNSGWFYVTGKSEPYAFIRLHNPWAQTEWKGDYSESDEKFTDVGPFFPQFSQSSASLIGSSVRTTV